MRILRWSTCVLALLAAFLMATPIAAQRPTPAVTNSYDNRTNQGLWAFGKWLREIGYAPERIERQRATSPFVIPGNTRGLIVLSARQIPDQDALTIKEFVRSGGTLVFNAQTAPALNAALGVRLDTSRGGAPHVIVSDRYFAPRGSEIYCDATGALMDTVEAEAGAEPTAITTLRSGTPTMVTFRLGLGRVYATVAPCMWTNGQLQNANAALLTRAIFRFLPAGSVIAFDEYHTFASPAVLVYDPDDFTTQGRRLDYTDQATPTIGISSQLTLTSWVTAVTASALIVLAYALLNGRRMGRVLRPRLELLPRLASDQAVALAGLVMRARDWRGPIEQLRARLKRAIGRPLGLDSGTPDAAFVAQVRLGRQDIPVEPLADLLADLAAPDIKRREVIDFDREVSAMIERYR
ncbi:MAG: hypothetical protein K1X39_07040 [Thermoflexales bacterium]|nr:hypothetical protein [Thermoflexales bacterium]